MNRTVLRVALLSSIATTAFADLPTFDEWLGTAEAFANTCIQLDPSQKSKYRDHVKSLLPPGTTELELTQLRQTAKYKRSYEALLVELNKGPKEQVATKGCPAFLETHN